MGFPMVQVFLIAARQVSKPIADSVIRYGKNHPLFRSKLLIPLGRGISRFTSRLRMKGLGLNMQVSQAPISEAAALEEASDFVQQLVLFSYSVGVFAGYYFYTKMTTPESLKMEEYQEFKEQQERAMKELRLQIESLEQRLAAQQRRNFFSQLGFAKDSNESPKPTQRTSESTSSENPPEEKSGSKRAPDTLKQRFQRISSLPIDAAASLILDGTYDGDD